MWSSPSKSGVEANVLHRSAVLSAELDLRNHRMMDRVFVWLMIFQWLVGICIALLVTPSTWIGEHEFVHDHVWLAAILGGAITFPPIVLGTYCPGHTRTRHVIAVSQALWGALLIHLAGGRIEAHFHVFCSLAFIAFYRDWKVIVTMIFVVALDHAVRGLYFPLSVYGELFASPFRWLEHTGWVVAESVVLLFACIRGKQEADLACLTQAKLEHANQEVENRVVTRTLQLAEKTADAERFALVAKHTRNSVLFLDRDCRITYINEGFTKITGYTIEEVRGKIPIDVLGGPTTPPEERENILAKLAAQKPFRITMHKHRKSGEPMILEVESHPIFDSAGQLVQYFQIESDITERERKKEELEKLTLELQQSTEELRKLSLVAKYTDNGVVITDAQSRIEWVNEGFTRLSGYGIDEVQGLVPGRFLQGPDTDQTSVLKIREAIKRKQGINLEILNYRKDGSEYWQELEIRPIHDPTGNLVNYISINREVTARKEADEAREKLEIELRDAARVAGMAEYAGEILHNVGNALNSISVSAQLLREQAETNTIEHLEKATELICNQEDSLVEFFESKRGKQFPQFMKEVSSSLSGLRRKHLVELRELINTVRNTKEIVASQMGFTHHRIPSEPASPCEIFEDTIKMCSSSLIKHQIQVIRKYCSTPKVLLEKHSVTQVLISLLRVAMESVVEAMPEHPVIKLDVKMEQDNQVRFSISDNGSGVEQSNLVEIFQQKIANKPNGMIYSLHTSANIAQELGGALTATSEGVGRGTEFTLRLPYKTISSPMVGCP